MKRTLLALMLLAASADAQVSTRPPGASGGASYDGGAVTNPFLAPDGAVGAPSYSFTNDADSGFYLIAPSVVGLSVDGVETLRFRQDGLIPRNGFQIWANAGAVGSPSYSFVDDVDSGFYRAANLVAVSVDGSAKWVWVNNGQINMKSDQALGWASGDPTATGPDVALARDAAGVVKATNGSTSYGAFRAGGGATYVGLDSDATYGNVSSSTGFLRFRVSGTTAVAAAISTHFELENTVQLSWGGIGAGQDTGLKRGAAGVVYVTNGSTGFGTILMANGTAAAPSWAVSGHSGTGAYSPSTGADIAWSVQGTARAYLNAAVFQQHSTGQFGWGSSTALSGTDTGLARNAAGVVGVTNGSSGSGALDVGNAGFMVISGSAGNAAGFTQPSGADNNGFSFNPGNNGALSVGIFRRANSASIELNGVGAATPSFITGFHASITAVTTTAAPGTKAESQKLYTNTGAGGTITITLPNDPALGTTYEFAVTVAQVFDIVPSTGESIQDAATNGTTKITSNTVGSTLRLVAVTGGSGAVWMVMSKNGTWTVS